MAGRKGGRRWVMRDGSVGGEGLRPELVGAGWEVVRDLAYGMEGEIRSGQGSVRMSKLSAAKRKTSGMSSGSSSG